MISLKTSLLISSILLLSCGLSEAGFLSRLNFKRTAVVNRFVTTNNSHYLLPLDKTLFNVTQPVSLTQVDLPVVFFYDLIKEVHVSDVPANFTIYRTDSTIFPSQLERLFTQRIYLNSTEEAKVTFPTPIPLQPENEYEIHVAIPEEHHLKFNEDLRLGQFEHRRFFAKNIIVNFNLSYSNSTPSDGLVKRIHLKYKVFG